MGSSLRKRANEKMSGISKIKGFYDLLGPESEKYSFMERKAREVFGRYGYREARIPLLERTELFARSIGEETDVVQKEMYTFPDRKGRSVSLRPEATAGVVRAYLENRLHTREQVSKLFTWGPMFRYERPQKGRQRQFHQVNVEMFGAAAPEADGEIILMLWTYLKELGLRSLRTEINSLGCRECRPGFQQALRGYLEEKSVRDFCPDCQRRSETNPMRVFDCKNESCQELLQLAPHPLDHLCGACRRHFEQVERIVAEAGMEYAINKNMVRGLDYYQRTAFEVASGDIGAQSSVAGGGRYDGLVRDLGGPDVPGIGFACGMERLAMLLDPPDSRNLDFYLAVLEEAALARGQLLAQQLRDLGLSGEASFEPRSLKSQLRSANKLGARKCLLLGSGEMQRGTLLVKDMQSGEQHEVDQREAYTAFAAEAR
jgi:histidyl-tRNA synthetase